MSTVLILAQSVLYTPKDALGHRVYPIKLKRAICQAYMLAKKKAVFCEDIKVNQQLIQKWIRVHMRIHGFQSGDLVVREAIVKVVRTEEKEVYLSKKSNLQMKLDLF